jgi:serine/threonine-protein kinase
VSIGKSDPKRESRAALPSAPDRADALNVDMPRGLQSNSSTMPAPEEGRLRTVSLEPGPLDEDDLIPTMRPPAPEDADPYLGCVIDGRYQVESRLGEGGMGVVYTCKHKLIGKRVAMKVLRADMARDPEVTSRFLNEARAASAIGNPHIIDISDFGRLPDGSTYFVMEYLDGLPLTRIIDPDQPLSVERIVHIGRQLAEGLAAAHHANIVHRDLKPDNIFLVQHGTERDFVKILDFGIAKVSTTEGRLTRAGQVFGTPHYMSPEQAAGSAVDHRGDIYSLGVIFYEMASGQVPFDAENFLGILTQHMYKAPAPIRKTVPTAKHVTPALEAITLKCLSKRQDQRYQTMDEIVADLDRLEAGQVPEAVADLKNRTDEFAIPEDYFQSGMAGHSSPGTVQARKHNWFVYAGVAGLLAAVAIVTAILAQLAQSDDNATARRTNRGRADVSAAAIAAAPPTQEPREPQPTPADETTVRQVVLATEPLDALVYLDGKNIGSSPVVVDVFEGQRAKLEIRRTGYKTKEVTVDGSEGRLSVKLEKASSGGRPVSRSPGAPAKGAGAPTDLANPWSHRGAATVPARTFR